MKTVRAHGVKGMLKRALAVVMAGTMVLSMAACGSEAEPAAESGSATVKIGGIGPLTGSAAVYGNAVYHGAQIAVDEINAKDPNFQFELNFQDDENDAEKAVNAYQKLKDWGVQLLLGTVTTTPCVAVSAETFADRVFELTPSASSTDVTKGKDNVFQLCFTDPNQGTTAAKYLVDNNLGEKIAVIYNNADAYSTGIYNAFTAELKKSGKDVVYTGTFSSDDNADFSVQLTGAQSAGADLVFMPIYYTPASMILAQASKMNYAPTFFGVDGMDGILAMEGFNKDLAENLMLMTPFNPWSKDEKVAAFVKTYEEKYGETPNQFAADAYDVVYAFYAACQAKGVTAETPASDACEAFVEYFTTEAKFDGLTGKGMTWGTNGEVSKDPVVCVIQGGIYVDR